MATLRSTPRDPGGTTLAEQVVAWHNRHPLALRIHRSQVLGLGWVVLPFSAAGAGAAQGVSTAAAEAGASPQGLAGSLRERALAKAQSGQAGGSAETAALPPLATVAIGLDPATPLRRAFSEDLLPPLSPRALERFARVHGARGALSAAARPRREALVDATLVQPGHGIVPVHLQSAAIETLDRRVRVVLGAGDEPTVLGPRLYSSQRVAVAVLLPLLLVMAAAADSWWWLKPQPVAVVVAAPVSPAASAGQVPGAATPASAEATAPAAVVLAASASVQALPSAAAAAAGTPLAADEKVAASAQPAVVAASTAAAAVVPPPSSLSASSAGLPPSVGSSGGADGAASLASIRPRLEAELARAARRESAALRAASAAGLGAAAAVGMAPAAEPGLSPAAAGGRPAAQPAKPAAPAREAAQTATAVASAAARPQTGANPAAAATLSSGSVFALVARTTKSRAASEILLGAMNPEAGRGAGVPRAEVLAADGGFRASLWPFGNRAQAERVQQRLRSGGLDTQLVEF